MSLHTKDMKDKLIGANSYLNAITGKESAEQSAIKIVKDTDIDRKKLDEQALNEFNKNYEEGVSNIVNLADSFRRECDAQRLSRDLKFCRLSHKWLMHGCLETLYRRKRVIEDTLAKTSEA